MQLHEQTSEAWNQLERDANNEQYKLVVDLNKKLQAMARKVESIVGEKLDVPLQPVQLELKSLSADKYHEDLNTLMQSGALAISL